MKHARITGFTFMELMIALAILGIVSSLAIPSYRSHLVRSHLTEAFSSLSVFRLAMEQAYNDTGNYGTGGNCAVANPTSNSFNYTCRLGTGGQSFTANATGNGSNGISGYTFAINETGIQTTTAFPHATVPVNCWLSSKSGC